MIVDKKISASDRVGVLGWLKTSDGLALLGQITEACHSLGLTTADERPGELRVVTEIGSITFKCSNDGVEIGVWSESEGNRFMLRETVIALIDQISPTLADGLCWDSAPDEGAFPPNFRVAEIVSIAEVGSLFWRLGVQADDLDAFGCDGLHLRLALPRHGAAPSWPRLNGKGRVRWPEKQQLHVAVYTIRTFEPQIGTLTIDVFRHEGGATSDWIETARIGDVVGLMGPGGGWLPTASNLTICGDETAIPAIARILESASTLVTGVALLEVEVALEYPLPDLPSGMGLRVLSRACGQTLESEMQAIDIGQRGSRHVWFAAEKKRASAMRRHLREERGVERDESYVTAYWQAN